MTSQIVYIVTYNANQWLFPTSIGPQVANLSNLSGSVLGVFQSNNSARVAAKTWADWQLDRRLDSHVPFLDTKEDWDNERKNWSRVVMDPGNDQAAWVYEMLESLKRLSC